MALKTEQERHQALRRQFWGSAVFATLRGPHFTTLDHAVHMADYLLEQFDKRFPAPKEPEAPKGGGAK